MRNIRHTVENIRPWSAERPNLYTFTVLLTDASGRELEVSRTMVGFRRFELKDGIMCLNGKRILFKGINRHEFNAKRGRAITEEDMRFDIRFMKQNNINAVRTCHYPNNSLWYQLCDRYGIYLIDETNLETHGTWAFDPARNVPASRPEWKAAVLDADALNALAAGELGQFPLLPTNTVLTPHPGEAARLLRCSVAQIQTDRPAAAQELAERYGCVAVLKGSGTLIAAPGREMLHNPTGNSGLARGGSGDVLAGMLAALLAQGLAPFDAAACAVWLHGAAADRCAARTSQLTMLPHDILTDLADVVKELTGR